MILRCARSRAHDPPLRPARGRSQVHSLLHSTCPHMRDGDRPGLRVSAPVSLVSLRDPLPGNGPPIARRPHIDTRHALPPRPTRKYAHGAPETRSRRCWALPRVSVSRQICRADQGGPGPYAFRGTVDSKLAAGPSAATESRRSPAFGQRVTAGRVSHTTHTRYVLHSEAVNVHAGTRGRRRRRFEGRDAAQRSAVRRARPSECLCVEPGDGVWEGLPDGAREAGA